VWRKLYAQHLAPLFARVLELTRVSTNTMWSNAAEWVGVVSDAALEYARVEAAEPFTAERVALLGAGSLPGVAGSNPLRGVVQWAPVDEPDFPLGVQTRVHCCMTYLLPDRLGRLCANCPFLPLEDRVALFRERHDRPLGAPGGAAEQRSIECGLKKVAEAAPG
jgi:ferric iron reductase protein FhuF